MLQTYRRSPLIAYKKRINLVAALKFRRLFFWYQKVSSSQVQTHSYVDWFLPSLIDKYCKQDFCFPMTQTSDEVCVIGCPFQQERLQLVKHRASPEQHLSKRVISWIIDDIVFHQAVALTNLFKWHFRKAMNYLEHCTHRRSGLPGNKRLLGNGRL